MNKISTLVVCLLACSTVGAQQSTPPGDGAMRQELQQKADAAFTESDRNHDGKLSLAEWQQARNQKLAEQFHKMDADNDGVLSKDELRQAHEQRQRMGGRHGEGMREKMQALDTDHDQALSRAEIGDNLPRLSENFDSIDSNHDGKITRDEMHAARESMHGQSR